MNKPILKLGGACEVKNMETKYEKVTKERQSSQQIWVIDASSLKISL